MIFQLFSNAIVRKEAERLARLAGLKSGCRIAEIGAGNGQLSVELTHTAGPKGEVFATEFDAAKFKKINRLIRNQGIINLHAILAAGDSLNLPDLPFDLIVMRKVYHHFSSPENLNRSFFKLLKPGGLLAIIDFGPKWYLRFSTPRGIPKNRGGHGIPINILSGEVTSAGFRLVRIIDNWSTGGLYCALFEKGKENSSMI